MKQKSDRTGVVFLIAMVSMVVLAGDSAGFRTALLGFSGIMLEALPFMLAGAVIGGIIEVYLPRDSLGRLKGKKLRTILLAALAGAVLPVCECAIVPVLYRLLRKGLPPEAGLAYLFAGPVVNPVVFLSTLTAYRFDVVVPLVRTATGYSCAVIAAVIVSRLLRGDIVKVTDASECEVAPGGSRVARAALNAAEDIFLAGRYFVMGALIASLFQSFTGRDTLMAVAEYPVVAIVGMMLMAFVLSICSDGDAFVAASFGKSFFPFSSQLAFMVMGPMLDIKLLMMYRMVFPRKTVLTIIPVLTVVVFLHAMAIHAIAGFL